MSSAAEREVAIMALALNLRTCRYCEYFTCEGERRVDKKPEDFAGYCHNSRSPRFKTTANNTCMCFHRDSGPA